jgi:hypothetical protein
VCIALVLGTASSQAEVDTGAKPESGALQHTLELGFDMLANNSMQRTALRAAADAERFMAEAPWGGSKDQRRRSPPS